MALTRLTCLDRGVDQSLGQSRLHLGGLDALGLEGEGVDALFLCE